MTSALTADNDDDKVRQNCRQDTELLLITMLRLLFLLSWRLFIYIVVVAAAIGLVYGRSVVTRTTKLDGARIKHEDIFERAGYGGGGDDDDDDDDDDY